MPKPPVAQRLLASLRQAGPQSPGALMSRLGVSQPTLYRAASAEPDRIFALGARRNRRLAAAREIRHVGASLPVFQVSAQGDIESAGKLLALQPSTFAFVLDSAPTLPRYYGMLPAFLADARPQGFLGDAFARRHADLHLPASSTDWSAEDCLVALARRGEDLPGNILIGEESFARHQAAASQPPRAVPEAKLAEFYATTATAAEKGEADGPLVGGGEPKITALIEDKRGNHRSVIVKFSAAGDSPEARRSRDLLVCEWLALSALRDAGIAAADARLIETGGRLFLEVERFDRVGAFGRRRTLSFAALGALPAGKKETWISAAAQVTRDGKLSPEDAALIDKLECFARMIANDDRGGDNLTFLWSPGEPHASLAPVYDMAPSRFKKAGTTYTAPLREHGLLRAWDDTLPLARRYWETVKEEARLSKDFRRIAEQALMVLER